MSFRVHKNHKYSPPAGEYVMGGSRPSRFTGTDIDGQVYQISNTVHTNKDKYRKGYDQIKWKSDPVREVQGEAEGEEVRNEPAKVRGSS